MSNKYMLTSSSDNTVECEFYYKNKNDDLHLEISMMCDFGYDCSVDHCGVLPKSKVKALIDYLNNFIDVVEEDEKQEELVDNLTVDDIPLD